MLPAEAMATSNVWLIGMPALNMVASVRVNRSTMANTTMLPSTGSRISVWSQKTRPRRVCKAKNAPKTTTPMTARISQRHLSANEPTAIRTLVGRGRSAWNSVKRATKLGSTTTINTPHTTKASVMMTAG